METNMNMQEQVNDFLNDLRDSGAINMFGAVPYIVEEFGVNKYEARDLLKNWMMSFSHRDLEEQI
jgi:hypothetical protein